MRLRRSSNPKLILGSESAIEGAYADVNGGRMPLVERDGSNEDITTVNCSIYLDGGDNQTMRVGYGVFVDVLLRRNQSAVRLT